ncbi:MAG TPA: hypothetical protein IAB45_05015 [Candidatus Onthousia faecavium]|nr:hypothetical protein [Candidatus Onthousia faecavium]
MKGMKFFMKVKLKDVLDSLEMVSGEIDYYYNPKIGKFFMSNIGEFEALNEDELDELFTESIILPTQYDIDEYSMMEEFAATVEDQRLQNQLYISLNGSGAFRRFKDTCINFDIINDWYKFKNEKYKEIAIDWCKENNIEFE